MSPDSAGESAKNAMKAVMELLEKAEQTTHNAISKATPAVQKSVVASMDAAAKGFNATMKSIDGATSREQLEVLKACRKVLGGQVDFVDSRILTLESKQPSPK